MPFQRQVALARCTGTCLFLTAVSLVAGAQSKTTAGSQEAAAASAAASGTPPSAPLQAVLIAPLDITHVHPGSTVFARVERQWSEGSCLLAPGSMVAGHVSALKKQSKADKISRLQLMFERADCKGNPEASPRFALLALLGTINENPGGGTSLDSGLPLAVPRGAGRSAQTAADISGARMIAVRKFPARIMPGDVFDIPKTHLEVATDQSFTDVVATGKDVRLETGTTLILMARHDVPATPAPALAKGGGSGERVAPPDPDAKAAPPPTAAPMAIPEPPDSTDVCTSACTQLGQDAEGALPKTSAAATLSLSGVGLMPASNRELARFTQDATVVYLDGNHLLCTFDPRHLRQRTEVEGEPSRSIRAVVVNTKTFKIEHVLDWNVRGNGQYLWQLSSGHLLVHLGRDLKELDSELKPVRSYHLDGRLAWVVSSPSGSHVAIGTVVERYSSSMRQQLEQALPEEPEEDIRVRLFNGSDHEVLSAVRSSHMPPPVLSDTGELRVEHESRDRWKITEIDWQRDEHVLGTTHTSCRPYLSAPRSDLIFMLGCTAVGSPWYRVLHLDGHPVLKAESTRLEFEHRAQASGDGAFAIRTVEATHALDHTQPFRPSDLQQERISIYSSSSGSRISTFSTNDFAPIEQGYALSPNGSQLAVMGRSALLFYAVPHAAQ